MKLLKHQRQRGFTVTEAVIVMSLLATLFGLIWLNLLNSREKAGTSSSTDVFVSDVRSQQLKAMLGDTEGRISADAYGVYLNSTSYTLFHGISYNALDPSNSPVQLGDNITFVNVSFPSNVIVFASGSGEIVGFSGAGTLGIRNVLSNTQKTVQLNKFGTVTSIQ